MPKVREKTKIYEAHQYTGKLAPAKKFLGIDDAQYDTDTRELIIPSIEEQSGSNVQFVAEVGDYILKDEEGNFSVVRAEYFDTVFEAVK